jgi:hypothetical protein
MFKRMAPSAQVLAIGLAGLLGAAFGTPKTMPQTITLERDCNGCPTGSRLTLHADGRARLETLGKARLGTTDQQCEGRVSIETFARLAQQATAGGFENLDDEYADPELLDGRWLTLRIDYADGRSKQVFQRAEAGPYVLTAFVSAVDAAGRQLVLDPPPE